VDVIQLEAVHFIACYSDFAAQDIAIEFSNPVLFCSRGKQRSMISGSPFRRLAAVLPDNIWEP
jgi:hypothetical protein